MHRVTHRTLAVAAALVAGSAILLAGPLDPPSGPVAPTYKTLSEVEPRIAVNATNTPGDTDSIFHIQVPGSYYLTEDITALAGTSGIEIAQSEVTLDLMGFHIRGKTGSLDGINVAAGSNSVTIRNGTVTTAGGSGINFVGDAASGSGCVIEDMHVTSNGSFGISAGRSGIVRGCTAVLNTGPGIGAREGTIIQDCTSLQNAKGIVMYDAGVVTGCTARNNQTQGIAWLGLTGGGSIIDCAAEGNETGIFCAGGKCLILNCNANLNQVGILMLDSATARGNTCSGNPNAGIRVVLAGNSMDGNTCIENGIGFDVQTTGNLLVRNAATGNGVDFQTAGGNGIGPIGSASTATSPWANIKY